jgi:hypothetical protein
VANIPQQPGLAAASGAYGQSGGMEAKQQVCQIPQKGTNTIVSMTTSSRVAGILHFVIDVFGMG